MTTFTETENYQYLLGLPIVSDLMKENKKLRKRNKELKRLIRLIGNNMSLLTPSDRKRRNPSFDYDDVVEVINIKKEKVVVDVADDEPNIAYEIIVKEPETEEEEEEDTDESGGIEEVQDSGEAEEAEAEAVEEEEEEEAVEEEEEEEAVEEEEEAVEEEEEEEEEAEEEEQADESGGIEEVQDSGEVEEEVYEVTIKGKSYYTTNETSGTIYGLDENGDVSLEVGVYKAGKPTFF
jgi:hypothetical protein